MLIATSFGTMTRQRWKQLSSLILMVLCLLLWPFLEDTKQEVPRKERILERMGKQSTIFQDPLRNSTVPTLAGQTPNPRKKQTPTAPTPLASSRTLRIQIYSPLHLGLNIDLKLWDSDSRPFWWGQRLIWTEKIYTCTRAGEEGCHKTSPGSPLHPIYDETVEIKEPTNPMWLEMELDKEHGPGELRKIGPGDHRVTLNMDTSMCNLLLPITDADGKELEGKLKVRHLLPRCEEEKWPIFRHEKPFFINPIPPGFHRLQLRYNEPGRSWSEVVEITLPPATEMVHPIRCFTSTAWLSGRVIDEDGNPVIAYVKGNQGYPDRFYVETDLNGEFEVFQPLPTSFNLVIESRYRQDLESLERKTRSGIHGEEFILPRLPYKLHPFHLIPTYKGQWMEGYYEVYISEGKKRVRKDYYTARENAKPLRSFHLPAGKYRVEMIEMERSHRARKSPFPAYRGSVDFQIYGDTGPPPKIIVPVR